MAVEYHNVKIGPEYIAALESIAPKWVRSIQGRVEWALEYVVANHPDSPKTQQPEPQSRMAATQ